MLLSACMRNRLPQAPTHPEDDPGFSAPEVVKPRGVDSDPPAALRLLSGDIIRLTTVSAKTEVYDGLIVDAMGQLHVPLGGDVQVGGMTLSQAEQAVEKALRRYDRFVRVNLVITMLDGHMATVVGAATNPRPIQSFPGHAVGGFTGPSRRPRHSSGGSHSHICLATSISPGWSEATKPSQ